MKRVLTTALILGISVPFGLLGCADESKQKVTEVSSTPEGETKTTVEKTVESSGNNPPPNSAGETATTPK